MVVATGLTFLAKPTLFRYAFRLLPRQVQPKLQTLIDAVCAYHGKWALLAQATGYSVAVHAFNNLIYVCAARARVLRQTDLRQELDHALLDLDGDEPGRRGEARDASSKGGTS
ncbi:hypothetical protein [Mycolicibacterium poriferae]|uniref:hypothetical protein n=1 Tax=Mycolicibacterium poriferae TaxID=39694 RepID=UPI003219C292